MEHDDNPISPVERLRDAPRCKAKAKRTGQPCRCPAVKGWNVCRVHGAGGGAPRGPANGMWRHGGRSHDVNVVRRLASEWSRFARIL